MQNKQSQAQKTNKQTGETGTKQTNKAKYKENKQSITGRKKKKTNKQTT